ncbi:MAG: hypothetical protein KJ060_18370 [Candidatus Hydrogenedentes bacterium]|nr:hypothetical protein [Candidatus Hydrogenedentota bacterium]
MNVRRFVSCVTVACVGLVLGSQAAPVTPGNILVSVDGVIDSSVVHEYTPGGVLVQSFPVEYPISPFPIGEGARDIAIKLGHTDVHVFNGTFDPYLSTLDSTDSTWTHQTMAGWSTVNNVSFGGAAVYGQYVFVTDMGTSGDPEEGIIRFDTTGSGPVRFATSIEPSDVNIGLNGMVYALENGTVHIYDPDTLVFQQSVDLSTALGIGAGDIRSIAANAAGQMFAVDWNGNLYKTDTSGNSLLSVDLFALGHAQSDSLMDVDVSNSGTVVVGDFGSGVVITNENFSTFTSFVAGSLGAFVAAPSYTSADLPLSPVTAVLLAVALVAVSLAAQRRMQQHSQDH